MAGRNVQDDDTTHHLCPRCQIRPREPPLSESCGTAVPTCISRPAKKGRNVNVCYSGKARRSAIARGLPGRGKSDLVSDAPVGEVGGRDRCPGSDNAEGTGAGRSRMQ